jgi:predicted nucleic acid-binding protein
MPVLDTCGWISWLTDDSLASSFEPYVTGGPVVPTVVLYEVTRWMRRERDAATADTAVASLRQCQVVVLDEDVALLAVDLAARHRLHMADAFVYAHAQREGTTLVTSDAAFELLPGVEYFRKP